MKDNRKRTVRGEIPGTHRDSVVSWQRKRRRLYWRQRLAILQRLGMPVVLGVIAVVLVVKAGSAVGADRAAVKAGSTGSAAVSDSASVIQGKKITALNLEEKMGEGLTQGIPAADFERHPEWTEDFLTPNEYSRPGDPLEEVTNIFVHYTANPGTSAAQNRSYFEQQKDVHEASVSSHFIIGYDGEILQIVPLNEIAYAVQTRNMDSISIECCYKAKDGQFTQETYDSLIALLSWLIDVYGLDSEDILRHYDCGGKKCPLYYVEHEDAWRILKRDVEAYE